MRKHHQTCLPPPYHHLDLNPTAPKLSYGVRAKGSDWTKVGTKMGIHIELFYTLMPTMNRLSFRLPAYWFKERVALRMGYCYYFDLAATLAFLITLSCLWIRFLKGNRVTSPVTRSVRHPISLVEILQTLFLASDHLFFCLFVLASETPNWINEETISGLNKSILQVEQSRAIWKRVPLWILCHTSQGATCNFSFALFSSPYSILFYSIYPSHLSMHPRLLG